MGAATGAGHAGGQLGTGGLIADGVRTIGLIVVAIIGALVVFVAAVFAVGILHQRQPPYSG